MTLKKKINGLASNGMQGLRFLNRVWFVLVFMFCTNVAQCPLHNTMASLPRAINGGINNLKKHPKNVRDRLISMCHPVLSENRTFLHKTAR